MNRKTYVFLRKYFVPVMIVIILIGIFLVTGTHPLAAPCKMQAEAIGLNWTWSPFSGCMIQQTNGTWTPINRIQNRPIGG